MFTHVKSFFKQNTFLAILLSVTFVLILTTGIVFKQDWLKMLPLFISLIIMVLQARVNRYALLIGSINSLIYCYYYYTVGLYTSLIYAIVVSFPLQLISFFTWHRKSKGSVTELRKMTALERIIGIISFAVLWVSVYFAMSFFNPSYSLLDTTVSIIGIAATILTMLRFSEYTVLQIISGIITIIMHVNICLDGNYANVTYLIFSIYSLTCVILAIIRMHKTNPEIIANRKR